MEPSTPQDRMEESPLATLRDTLPSAYVLSDGPIRYLLVAGDRDDGQWGTIGAFWRSIDGGKGGFFVSPELGISPEGRAPHLGEHTRAILTGDLGLTDGDVDALTETGVAR